MPNCENCGCKIYSGRCTNCHEELIIVDQYYDSGIKLPDSESEFMLKAKKQQKEIDEK